MPVSFLGEVTCGAGSTVPCNADPEEDPGETVSVFDEYDSAPYLESWFQLASAPDASVPGGEYITEWREAHVDPGAALIAGDWSGEVPVNLYATAVAIPDRFKTRTVRSRVVCVKLAACHPLATRPC